MHHLVEKFEQLFYFPAYELVIDDLRDYRFFAEDMVHPNYLASDYVWEQFRSALHRSVVVAADQRKWRRSTWL